MEDAAAGPAVREREPARLLVALLEAGDEAGVIAYARELHPAELANACASIEGDLRDLLVARLTANEIGAMLGYLEPHYREDLLVGLAPDRIAAILSGVSDDVATDVVQELPEQIGTLVLEAVPDPQQAAIDVLMEHAEDTAGGRACAAGSRAPR